jgi:serpin B
MLRYLNHTLIIGFILFGAVLSGTAYARPGSGGLSLPEGKDTKSDTRSVIENNTSFALDLFAKLKEDPALKKAGGNLFFSPFSLSTALAMTWAGARGETEKQMAQVLHFTLPQGREHPAFARWQKEIHAIGNKVKPLSTANALWVQEGFKLLDAYVDLIGKHYGGGLSNLDFRGALEAARKTINAWVEEKTKGKISELIKPGDMDAATDLVLTNAIHFKSKWTYLFDAGHTKMRPFKISPDREVQVPMMSQVGLFGYAEREGLKILRLPYAEGRLSMVLLLPEDRGGLEALEQSLSVEKIKGCMESLGEQQLTVQIPRFKMTSRFSLERTLNAMGMPDAFSPGQADFSGMTGSKGLFISRVIHEAVVEVNEEGTESAAATGVVMKRGGPVFRADHPFLFLIRDDRTGGLLFMGRLVKPA